MASVVLLGAGASFGSLDAFPYTPPLGNGDNGLFSKLEAAGGLASSLPEELKATFRTNFEKGMSEYYEFSNGTVMNFQRELATYLAQFKPGPTNTYLSLIRTLGIKRVIYSSLNYDLLFELSAAALGLSTTYSIEPHENCARLLKLHGSCNFWPNIPIGSCNGLVVSRSGRADVQAPILTLTQEDAIYRCINDIGLAPAIAMYAEGKAVKISPDYVAKQQSQWLSAVFKAKHIFVIGVRVHNIDKHIWEPLAFTNASVTYFGLPLDKPEFLDWRSHVNKKNAFFIDAPFSKSINIIKSRLI